MTESEGRLLAERVTVAVAQAVADVIGKSEGREEGWGIWYDATYSSVRREIWTMVV